MKTPDQDNAPTLTAKQRAFVREYLIDLNATQAAIRAGYSARTARSVGAENLTKPDIAAAIAAAQTKRAERTEVTQDYVLSRLVQNVERAMQAEPVYDKDGKPTGEYTYQGAVANTALNLLGKHLGMFVERVETRDKTFEDMLREVAAEGADAEAAREAERVASDRRPDIGRAA